MPNGAKWLDEPLLSRAKELGYTTVLGIPLLFTLVLPSSFRSASSNSVEVLAASFNTFVISYLVLPLFWLVFRAARVRALVHILFPVVFIGWVFGLSLVVSRWESTLVFLGVIGLGLLLPGGMWFILHTRPAWLGAPALILAAPPEGKDPGRPDAPAGTPDEGHFVQTAGGLILPLGGDIEPGLHARSPRPLEGAFARLPAVALAGMALLLFLNGGIFAHGYDSVLSYSVTLDEMRKSVGESETYRDSLSLADLHRRATPDTTPTDTTQRRELWDSAWSLGRRVDALVACRKRHLEQNPPGELTPLGHGLQRFGKWTLRLDGGEQEDSETRHEQEQAARTSATCLALATGVRKPPEIGESPSNDTNWAEPAQQLLDSLRGVAHLAQRARSRPELAAESSLASRRRAFLDEQERVRGGAQEASGGAPAIEAAFRRDLSEHMLHAEVRAEDEARYAAWSAVYRHDVAHLYASAHGRAQVAIAAVYNVARVTLLCCLLICAVLLAVYWRRYWKADAPRSGEVRELDALHVLGLAMVLLLAFPLLRNVPRESVDPQRPTEMAPMSRWSLPGTVVMVGTAATPGGDHSSERSETNVVVPQVTVAGVQPLRESIDRLTKTITELDTGPVRPPADSAALDSIRSMLERMSGEVATLRQVDVDSLQRSVGGLQRSIVVLSDLIQ